jgi:hypothetical protein
MGNHRHRLAVVNREGRHVIVLKLLVLIVAKNNHEIDARPLQNFSDRLYGLLAGFIPFAHLFESELPLDTGLGSLEECWII